MKQKDKGWIGSKPGRKILHLLTKVTDRMARVQLSYDIRPMLKELCDERIEVPYRVEDRLGTAYGSTLQTLIEDLEKTKKWIDMYTYPHCPPEQERQIEQRIFDLSDRLAPYEPLLAVALFLIYVQENPESKGKVHYLWLDTPPESLEALLREKRQEQRERIRFYKGLFDENHRAVRILRAEDDVESLRKMVKSSHPELQEEVVDLSAMQETHEIYRLLQIKRTKPENRYTADLCACYTTDKERTGLGLYVIKYGERMEPLVCRIPDSLTVDSYNMQERMLQEQLRFVKDILKRREE
ncbi:MAG: hypothetical protein QT02_C0009G0017 [archaeon GW2011_AR9]|nr:MAG: hypothetical protein QT02_C0009G0017 [archaeon GW2011_AR9]HIG93800.1 hypothetical protein [Candidatus Woesearchaeota archaeon]HIH13311.1 hypothetical protein [Candidatus Woesearchaeota archaeon]